ncbi:hypothetical protein VCHSUH04_05910 [Veillonella sp. T14073-2]|uniref:hypothetical protein n=1 Tax=Veillonella sp. T14073-2 TaxID=1911680 RepID=UPI000CF41DF3|nr:hypothetical protein [Veillonella sp. T14073-2]PQL22455.1 hypothetical protein VCHSUH04_05910 [Veillonella sp. T14073-2]
MEYIVKAKCYHNTLGLLHEGETVTFTKDEVDEYDKDYFNSLFEPVGDASAEVEPAEETVEETTPKKRGKKAEETAE